MPGKYTRACSVLNNSNILNEDGKKRQSEYQRACPFYEEHEEWNEFLTPPNPGHGDCQTATQSEAFEAAEQWGICEGKRESFRDVCIKPDFRDGGHDEQIRLARRHKVRCLKKGLPAHIKAEEAFAKNAEVMEERRHRLKEEHEKSWLDKHLEYREQYREKLKSKNKPAKLEELIANKDNKLITYMLGYMLDDKKQIKGSVSTNDLVYAYNTMTGNLPDVLLEDKLHQPEHSEMIEMLQPIINEHNKRLEEEKELHVAVAEPEPEPEPKSVAEQSFIRLEYNPQPHKVKKPTRSQIKKIKNKIMNDLEDAKRGKRGISSLTKEEEEIADQFNLYEE
jgi:hypothetical protein